MVLQTEVYMHIISHNQKSFKRPSSPTQELACLPTLSPSTNSSLFRTNTLICNSKSEIHVVWVPAPTRNLAFLASCASKYAVPSFSHPWKICSRWKYSISIEDHFWQILRCRNCYTPAQCAKGWRISTGFLGGRFLPPADKPVHFTTVRLFQSHHPSLCLSFPSWCLASEQESAHCPACLECTPAGINLWRALSRGRQSSFPVSSCSLLPVHPLAEPFPEQDNSWALTISGKETVNRRPGLC